jgi:hypothetical protein
MPLGYPCCGSILTDVHHENCPVAGKAKIAEVLQKLEVHRSLGDASPGFHLSEGDIRIIVGVLRLATQKCSRGET